MTQFAPLAASMTFIGNATTLLRLGGFTVLTDPTFVPAGSRVHLGYGAFTRRLIDPAMTVDQLPRLDAVVLSHLHGDHFDRVARENLAPVTPIFTTPQARRVLRRWNFRAVRALPTWQTYDWARGRQRLRITAVPGRHGPGVADWLLPEVMGSVIELHEDGVCRLRLYITGDTLHRPSLAEVPRRCGDIDAMIIHLGGTRLLGMLLTMDDRHGVDLAELIRPRLTLPVHYDDYSVFTSPLSDFLDRAREHGLTGVRPIARGDTFDLPLRAGAAVHQRERTAQPAGRVER
jgi:L-ascorbate metabolism protein UlaG (beta-lactamase superfamily)